MFVSSLISQKRTEKSSLLNQGLVFLTRILNVLYITQKKVRHTFSCFKLRSKARVIKKTKCFYKHINEVELGFRINLHIDGQSIDI